MLSCSTTAPQARTRETMPPFPPSFPTCPAITYLFSLPWTTHITHKKKREHNFKVRSTVRFRQPPGRPLPVSGWQSWVVPQSVPGPPPAAGCVGCGQQPQPQPVQNIDITVSDWMAKSSMLISSDENHYSIQVWFSAEWTVCWQGK